MSKTIITLGGAQFEWEIERDGQTFRSGSHEVTIVATRDHIAELRVDGRTFTVPFLLEGTKISFLFDGETYVADVAAKGSRARARHRDHSLSAPMPGLVLKILVEPGQKVIKGTPLAILEAMKMEHGIIAPYDGVVKAIHCREGEMVEPGMELVELVAS